LGDASLIEAQDGEALVREISARPVNLALIDLQMPKMLGGQRLAEVAQLRAEVPLVVFSSISSPQILRQVMSIPSVYAFLLTSASSETVHAAIEAAIERRRFYGGLSRVNAAGSLAGLTPRQKEICALMRHGMSNEMIAAELGISKGTVSNHVTKILKILNASNRTQVAHTAIDSD
jgi:two-component system response regulator DesR